MRLRGYQHEAVESSLAALKRDGSALIVLPTGTGKTVVFSHIAGRVDNSKRVMIVAHRDELIRQAAEKIKAVTGEMPGIEKADEHSDGHSLLGPPRYVVSSVQTLTVAKARRLERFDASRFGLLVVDEAHHAASKTYLRVINHFKDAGCPVLGVTATPKRHDKLALRMAFGSCAYEMSIREAISGGWLVPVRQISVSVASLDFGRVTTSVGDFRQQSLGHEMCRADTIAAIAHAIIKYCHRRRTIVFAPTVDAAHLIAKVLNEHTPGSAGVVSAKTHPGERSKTLRRFTAGEMPWVINVGVLTEGYDDPGVEMICLARPTKSVGLYTQMIGRGFRPLPGVVDSLHTSDQRREAIAASGKPCLEVIDFEGQNQHKITRAVDVLAGDMPSNISERVKRREFDRSGARDVIQDIEIAVSEEAEWRRRVDESIAAAAAAGVAEFTVNDFDPFGDDPESVVATRIKRVERARLQPSATPRQIVALLRVGINGRGMTRLQASAALKDRRERMRHLPSTHNQVRALAGIGVDARMMTAAEARDAYITRTGKAGVKP